MREVVQPTVLGVHENLALPNQGQANMAAVLKEENHHLVLSSKFSLNRAKFQPFKNVLNHMKN